MTPGARIAAAIEVLDVIGEGVAAEQALTRWARQRRFAGSKDRAAIRDHVFDVLRQRDTAAYLGGGDTGRALMLGLLRIRGDDPEVFFDGQGHAPEPMSDNEKVFEPNSAAAESTWNLPEWLVPEFERSLGDDAWLTAVTLQERAPISVRVNIAKTTRTAAIEQLRSAGIESRENPVCSTALTLVEGARRLRNAPSYLEGFVELQDAASQAVIEALPNACKCLDFCAGGGGKALALAAQSGRRVFAFDTDMKRMKDLAARANRAGAKVTQLRDEQLDLEAPFDLVLCDAPCSGSGAWRRAPGAKWHFTHERLLELCEMQEEILAQAARLVSQTGTLVFATCSVLRVENEDRVAEFLRKNTSWTCSFERRIDVGESSDGFYSAHLTRVAN